MCSKKEININNYNDDAIQVLEGLDAVQTSRMAWIGQMEMGSPFGLGNCRQCGRDEVLSGFGSQLTLPSHKRWFLSVADQGQRDADRDACGKPTVEVIRSLHAGRKFGQGAIRHLRSVFTEWDLCRQCPSSRLEAEITRDGAVYKQRL